MPAPFDKQFQEKLSLLFEGDADIVAYLKQELPLQQRYQFDTKAQQFSGKGKKKFISYTSQSLEKEFYTLIHPKQSLGSFVDYLSESELIKYYLIYNWAADYAHQHHMSADWKTQFLNSMHQHILQKKQQSAEAILAVNQANWSAAKTRLYGLLLHGIAGKNSIEQKIYSYYQLIEQSEGKHFYHDGSKQHIFSQYAEAVSRYEYELLMHELTESMQPMLYYPKSVQQKINLLEYARHCLFYDFETDELKYINSYGTVFTLPEHQLLAKSPDEIEPATHGKWSIPYKKGTQSWELRVSKQFSEKFGAGYSLDGRMLKSLVPMGFPEDPLLKLVDKTLKKTKNYFFSLQRMLSLFGQDQMIAFQHRTGALIQIKETLLGKTTREIREVHSRPSMQDYMGCGRNTYVFFEHPSEPSQSELWHVDRSQDTPVLTQYPLSAKQSDQLCYLFCGARSEAPPLPEFDDAVLSQKFYQIGKEARQRKKNDQLILLMDEEMAREIPKLALSDMPIYRHLLDDRTYYETSNELIDVCENTEKTPENTRLIERCRTIHQQLELIEQDRLHAFPESRGVVPPDKRRKIMQMMIELIKDKNSPKARHYFRTEHQIYLGYYRADHIDQYAPASFIWDGADTLCYLDEKKNKIDVPMTDSIRRKMRKIMENPNPEEHTMSANDVYELMTRPRLFYYYCGIPIGLDFRWLDFSYYVPLKFDRSQGLHTGTAQELMREIHEQKLSVTQLLYKFGEALILLIIPLILTACGIAIPYPDILGTLGACILDWFFLLWNIEYTFNYLRFTLLMNDLAQPELNQLDKMLVELNHEVKKMSDIRQEILTVPTDDPDWDAGDPYSYLSQLT